ncbi:hypothetical protein TrLO_g8502 [Triparma laevis f. longispina]|uniref:Uncharacterized protein n=1 Tax=Triparma laevis f. longispina TaxID=1714387 RepID=A0A9W7F3D8_9STRA|nr:hypothetical protein TrLO_g8502 [Triparma laevis f. longispina]
MRSEGAIQPATKVVIISVIFIAGMISMGGIVGVLNSTVNNLRISNDTTVCLDLGGGGVTNDNRIDPTMDDNVEALGSEDTMQCMMGTFITVNKGIALRDIEVGEEVTMNYKDNESEAAYEELGLGKWGYARWYDSENYALGV